MPLSPPGDLSSLEDDDDDELLLDPPSLLPKIPFVLPSTGPKALVGGVVYDGSGGGGGGMFKDGTWLL